MVFFSKKITIKTDYVLGGMPMKKKDVMKTVLCTLAAALIAVGISVASVQTIPNEQSRVSMCIFDLTEVSD